MSHALTNDPASRPPRRLPRAALAPRYWGSWAALALLFVAARLPLRVARLLGAGVGLLLYAGNRKRREIADINVRLCFPALDARARRRFILHHYLASGQAYLDLGLLAWGAERRVLRAVRFHGLERYRALAGSGRGIILLVSHSVAFNFGGALMSRHHALFAMYKPQSNPLVDWVLERGRARFGARLIRREQGMRPVLRGLRAGEAFFYVADEDFGAERSVFAPFFGMPTATLPTLGRLAASGNAVVVPFFAKLLPGGRGYEVFLGPPLEDFPSGDAPADAARMNEVLEADIRRAPEQYMWTFKLFKTRPGGAPSPYPQKKRKRKTRG
jgi:lipid A biosynthesis lauroyl/palmitoleoyl acyltransferase